MNTDRQKERKTDRIHFGGLFRTIFGTSMLCMLIPLAVTVIFSVMSIHNRLETMESENLMELSGEKMNELSLFIKNQSELTKALAGSPFIAQAVADQYHAGTLNPAENEKLMRNLTDIFESEKGLYENFFITCGATGIADGLNGETLHEVTGEPWYDTCMKEGSFIGNNISPVTGKPVYVISYAIADPKTGEFVGGINNSIDLAAMTQSITQVRSDDLQILIMDQEGLVVASMNENEILSLNLNEENESTASIMKTAVQGKSAKVSFVLNGISNIGAVSESDGMYTLVFLPESVFTSAIYSLLRGILVVAVISFIAATLFDIRIAYSIIHSLNRMVAIIKRNGNADFSQDIPKKLLKRKDEIGTLAVSMEKMQTSIRRLFQDIMNETGFMDDNVEHSNEKIQVLANKITTVNDLTVERASEMEETAAGTDVMMDNTSSMISSISSINEDIAHGKEVADGISLRAENLKQNAVQSQKQAEKLTSEINQKLRDAIEQSKQVSKIHELSESILEIASQTNLLSLNASIEAARAGDHGKGFAVVAEEIRVLAENSQNSVTAIQDVTNHVVIAVHNLSSNAEKVLRFIDESVIADYQKLVDIGEQYYTDSQSVKQLVKAIHTSSQELTQAMESIGKSLQEIAAANNDGAAGIHQIAKNTTDISENANDVSEMMGSVKDSAQKLKQSIGRFSV